MPRQLENVEITIRPYTDDDYRFTHDLHHRNMGSYVDRYWGGWDSEIFRRDVQPEITWIIEIENRNVGFFVLSLETKAHLKNIQIHPDFQSSGLGSRIVGHCEAKAVKNGFDTLFLEVFLDNPARRLYERLGYGVYEVTSSHYLMSKTLNAKPE